MDVQGSTKVNKPDLIEYGPCFCMGPQGTDPYCPCEMRQRGLNPTNPWTPEKIKELEDVLANIFQWDKK